MLQINQEVVQDVRPPMKTQQLRYLQRLYRVPEKARDGCLQKVVSADRVSGAFAYVWKLMAHPVFQS